METKTVFSTVRKALEVALALGVVASPAIALASVTWMDTVAAERAAGGWPISDRNTVNWAYANRSANEVCRGKGYSTGRYTGNQSGELMGVYCENDSAWFDLTLDELAQTPGWGQYSGNYTDINQQISIPANTAAHLACTHRGYGTGYFTGHQSGNFVGVNCIAKSRVVNMVVSSSDFSFPLGHPLLWKWWQSYITANDICNYYGHQTGVANEFDLNSTGSAAHLYLSCID